MHEGTLQFTRLFLLRSWCTDDGVRKSIYLVHILRDIETNTLLLLRGHQPLVCTPRLHLGSIIRTPERHSRGDVLQQQSGGATLLNIVVFYVVLRNPDQSLGFWNVNVLYTDVCNDTQVAENVEICSLLSGVFFCQVRKYGVGFVSATSYLHLLFLFSHEKHLVLWVMSPQQQSSQVKCVIE